MASQFESMKFSFMVMTTLPLAMIGSFFMLWLTDASISMVSLLGFMMLVGTVVNNGILYVDTVVLKNYVLCRSGSGGVIGLFGFAT
jgi:HAE1 family hydrophobic/amphiphilic exporter-1